MVTQSRILMWGARAFGVVAFVVTIAAVTWSLLSQYESRKNEELLLAEATNARDLVVHDLRLRLATLRRIGRRLAQSDTLDEADFSAEASSYLADMPGFFAISWVNENDRIHFVEPPRSKRLIGTHLGELGPQRLEIANFARTLNGPVISQPIMLANGDLQGFIVALTVHSKGKFRGTLWTVFQAQDWIENLYFGASVGALDDLSLAVSLGGMPLYRNEQFSALEHEAVSSGMVRVANSVIVVSAKPTASFYANTNNGLTVIVTALVATLSLACLVAAVALRVLRIQQGRTARANRRLRKNNHQMQLEVTQRRIAEESAKRASAAKSQFLSTMSHEFRTPMNGVIGMSELLADANLPEPQASQVYSIRKSGEALLDIMSDILDFSKFESGEITLQPKPCDPREIVKDAVNIFLPAAEKKGLTLRFDCAPDVPTHLLLDAARYRQITLNLLRNAMKFTDSGAISVSLEVLSLSTAPQLVLVVEDTGIGIANEKLAEIFGAFQQADGASSRQFEGTGLGLAIVRHLARAMGGNIDVASKVQKGSKFTVTIPAVTAEQTYSVPENPVKNMPIASVMDARVLLAEDNKVNQKIVAGYLKGSGVHLDVAADGQEAISRYQDGTYDAILMDISMPNMNGFDATRKIRAIERDSNKPNCPILGYTANFGEDDQRKCRSSGMDDVLGKPATKRELIGCLAHWIDKGRADAQERSITSHS